MKNKPKFVFLQMGLEEENSVEDFNSLYLDCVTLETEQVYSDDLQFISIDFILERIKESENVKYNLTDKNAVDRFNTNSAIVSTLKQLIK